MKKKIIKFDKTDGMNVDEYNLIANAYRDWSGKGEAVFQSPTRTPKQNRSLHLYCEWMACTFNDKHIPYVESYFGKEFEREWTMELVKEKAFKPILKALCGKTSTAKSTTTEICQVADYIEKNLSLKLEIDLRWPDRNQLELEKTEKSQG